MAIVETQKQGDVAVIRMDNPPVNALGHALRVGLEKAFDEANADAGVKAIVLTGTGKFFSAGADITEFSSEMKEPFLPQLIDKIEASAKPVVAAVNGTALGGGLELALGCHYRVAGKDVRQLGLPEIKLGIIPGAGGTQRLPRAIGVEQALQLITTGAFIDAAKGAAAGLIDKVADGDVVAAAVAFAKEQIGKPPRRIGEKKIDKASIPAGLFEKARASHRPAPERARSRPRPPSTPWRPATTLPLGEGNARERQVFREAAASPYARALQYAFFAERQAANLPGIGPDAKLRDIKTVGILGAGTMGTGIGAGLPQRRLSRDHRRDHAGGARPRRRPHQGHAVGQRQARPHHRGAGRRPLRQAHAVAEDGGPRQGRPHHRGRVREHGAEEGDLRRSSTRSPSPAPSSPPTPPPSTSTRSPPSPSGRRTWWGCTSSRPPTSCACWRSCAPRRPATT